MKKEVAVVAAIIKKDDEIFCTQRPTNKPLPLKWEFPGGKLEKNESEQDALIREIKEELATEIKIIEQFSQTICEYDFAIVHLTTFICEFINDDYTLVEHHDAKWVKIADLAKLDWLLADIEIIEMLENKYL